MARHTTNLSPTASAAAALLFCAQAAAQPASTPAPSPAPSPATTPAATTRLAPVTITVPQAPIANVSGWGNIPLAQTPVQATVIGTEQLRDLGAQRLADVVAIDPAVSDGYNAVGYWDFLTVRGFVLDNRYNYLRDGLPINAETSIPLDNKSRIEILKGISGMQAGTSAPGGLANFVVKRPTDAPLRSIGLEWRQAASVIGNVDLSQRFGVNQAFGVRLNAAAAHLDPLLRSSEGNRSLFAIAADWRLSADTLLEAEVETSRRSQPSQPGFSMLGDVVPAPVDPRLSLNNQPWSLPVVFNATTASLRWQQRLDTNWRFVAHAMTQRLRTDDRIAFPFGCTAADGSYYADRYCPDGTYDLYDFRSENERRRSDALDLSLHGTLRTGTVAHALTGGLLITRARDRFQQQAFNFAGTGNVAGTLITPADPALTDESTNRDERSTALHLRDAISINRQLTAWLGVRHTRLDRESVRTDGSRATQYEQSLTTPWIAASYAYEPGQLVYASWGRGVESTVVPNRDRYTNAGEALPALKSRQIELGLKGSSTNFDWGLAWFDIQRPQFVDVGTCDLAATCTTELDGRVRHRGVELDGAWRRSGWTLRGGAQWLHARREASRDPSANGLEPTNVPAFTLKLQADHDVAAMPGLTLQARVTHEGRRMVLPDNSATIPAWTRFDAAARYDTKLAGTQTIWRVGIDNLFDKRAWRESPYQFSHSYLYPLAPRTLRVSLRVEL